MKPLDENSQVRCADCNRLVRSGAHVCLPELAEVEAEEAELSTFEGCVMRIKRLKLIAVRARRAKP